MKLNEKQYKELCKLCPFIKFAGNRRVCTFGVGCYKGDKLNEIRRGANATD